MIQVSSLHFGLAALSIVPEALAYRTMNFKWTASIDLIAGLVASLATLLLALKGAGVWALVLGSLAGATVRSALFLGSHPVRPVFRFGGLRGHVAFGGTLATSRLAWHVVNQADVFTAARFLTPSAVGLYSVSLHLATLPMQRIMGIVNQVVFPTVARLQEDRPRLRERLLSGLRLLGFVSVPVMWGISAVAPEIVALALGPRWHDAVYPLQVASLLIPFKMVSAVISTAIVGVGAATLDLRNTVVNLVVLPSAFLIGVRWGVDGLVTAWALSLVVVLALTVPRSCTRLEIALLDVARSLRDPSWRAASCTRWCSRPGRAGRRAPRLPAGHPRARRGHRVPAPRLAPEPHYLGRPAAPPVGVRGLSLRQMRGQPSRKAWP